MAGSYSPVQRPGLQAVRSSGEEFTAENNAPKSVIQWARRAEAPRYRRGEDMQENIKEMKKKGQERGEQEIQEGRGRVEEEFSQRTGMGREGSEGSGESSERAAQEKRRKTQE